MVSAATVRPMSRDLLPTAVACFVLAVWIVTSVGNFV
jgi:hypothetical protein